MEDFEKELASSKAAWRQAESDVDTLSKNAKIAKAQVVAVKSRPDATKMELESLRSN